MNEFETKDSGQHEQYASGMRRDSQAGKPRFDLIRTKAQPYKDQMIYRYAMLLARGAEKYEDRNWEEGEGEEELERAKASLLRHTEQLVAGERDEDHAAAVWFNAQQIEYLTWRMEQKALATKSEPTLDFTLQGILANARDGDKVFQMLTGQNGAFIRGDIRTDSPLASDGTEKGFQDAINEWHNRKVSHVYAPPVVVTPGPPATPEDRIRARVNVDTRRLIASPGSNRYWPRKRVGEWLEEYGIEILEGFVGELYDEIDLVEFDKRLKCDGVIIRKSPVDDAPSFD